MAKNRSSHQRAKAHESLQKIEESAVLNRVSFRLRQRESVLGWTLAGFSAWVGVVIAPGQWMPWAGVIVAIGMALWARTVPARKPGKVILRYGLLAVMALLLMADPAIGGSTGPMLFWPLAIACSAVLMLRGRWALVVVVMVLVAYFAASWLEQPHATWARFLSALAEIVGMSCLAFAFGQALRTTDAQLEAAMTDLKTKLYNASGFFTYGIELLAQCRARKKPLAIVLLNGADIHDVHELVGRIASERLISQAVQTIIKGLPPGGLAAHMGQAEFAVLIPEVNEERAQAWVEQKLGAPPTVKIKVGQKDLSVVFDMVASEIPMDADYLEPLYERLYGRLSKMRRSLEVPTTALLDSETFMPDMDRAISPTVPMALMRKR